MPGKYSHSVVLASYSSRGIIALPNDQHAAYLRSSPYSSRCSSSVAKSRPNLSNKPQDQSQSTDTLYSHQAWNVTSASKFTSPRRHVIVDPATRSDQISSVAGPLHSSVQPVAYRPVTSDRSTEQSQSTRQTQNNLSYTNGSKSPTVIQYGVDTGSLDRSPNPSIGQGVRATQATPTNNYKSIRSSRSSTALRPTHIVHEPKTSNTNTPTQSPNIPQSVGTPHRRRASEGSINTQIYSPESPTQEPDFDGFSDSEESGLSYFEDVPSARSTGAADGGVGMLSVLRNSVDVRPPRSHTKSRQSQTRTAHSSYSLPATSSEQMNGKLDSLSSQSSLGSWDAAPRISKNVEVKRPNRRPSASAWELPEIEENRIFGPDLFTQELDDGMRPATSHLAMDPIGVRKLGMISSGRDFNVDDDSESVASAACPPDIGRFRDEEMPSTLPRLLPLPIKSSEKTSTLVPMTSPKAKKGFFSRLRSKSRSGF